MSEYTKTDVYRYIGLQCLIYGLAALLVVISVGLYLKADISLWPDRYLMAGPMYIALVAIPVILIFAANHYFNEVRTFPTTYEAVIAIAAILGFGVPLTALGVLLIGITIPDYDGVERWLPDIKDRSYFELSELQNAVSELELSENVQLSAEQLLEQARDRNLMKGRSFSAILGGVIYIVARDEGEPRTLDEIAETVRSDKRDIGKAYRYIGRELDIRIYPPSPEDYLSWFAGKLGLSQEVEEGAENIVHLAKRENLVSGKSSKGIAAAAVYLSAYMEGEHRSLNEMSEVLNVTTVTIRERSKDIVKGLGLQDIPSNLRENS